MHNFRSAIRRAHIALLASFILSTPAWAQFPSGTVHPALRSIVAFMPEGTWSRVNQNAVSDVSTPPSQRPLVFSTPGDLSLVIHNWSGFAWDSGRGELMLYGGGHQSYSGNDVYRWRSSTLQWERASLPSEIRNIGPNTAVFTPIDGPDAGPSSAHTYDNNIYLPIIDRFMVLGGAAFNTGGNYLRLSESDQNTYRSTGPYLFDASRADPDKVGGTTGSQVQRVAPHPEVVGGNMWQNRDITLNLGAANIPMRHVAGCTGYNAEGGRDVVYIGAHGNGASVLSLYRYEIDDVGMPSTDKLTQVGTYWYGSGGQTACSYDPNTKVFARTNTDANPFAYWDLTAPGSSNRDKLVENDPSIAAFSAWLSGNSKHVYNCGLDIDPLAQQFAVWCGGGSVWMLDSPSGSGTAGWTITQLPPQGSQFPPDDTGTGVLGKWKYVPGYDVFVALEGPTMGNVWVYKPFGWSGADPADTPPQVSLTSPGDAATYDKGSAIPLSADASDTDGSVSKVEYFANGVRIGVATISPYSVTWTPRVPGAYAVVARATDDRDGSATSATANVTVNNPPTVAIASPASGAAFTEGRVITVTANASDSDGTVTNMQIFANGGLIATFNAAPYTLSWTPSATGSYDLVAKATDNVGSVTTSATVSITVNPANVPPTVNITAPADGAQLDVGAPVTLSADASDADGTVTSVQFRVNGSSVGVDSTSPYSVTWTPSSTGTFTLTAVATDNSGASTTSAAVTVDVVPAGGATVAVLQRGQNGYAGVTDTMLSSYSKTANYGSRDNLLQYYQQYVALFRFSIFASEGGPVPDDATIQSAKLEIAYNAYSYTYALYALKKPWSEAQATWNVSSAGFPWSSGGADGAGTDYESTPDAQATVGQQAGWIPFDVTARVRAIGMGTPNYGWRILGVSGTQALRALYASEYATASLRPKLTVTYTVP